MGQFRKEYDWLADRSICGQCRRESAEGSGRGSNADYKRFIRIARGSLYETRHWLRRAYKRELLTKEQIESLTPLLDELTPILNADLRSTGTFDNQKPNTKAQKPIDS